jgi:hypothetical protein
MWSVGNVRKAAWDVYVVQSATSIVDLGGTDEVNPELSLVLDPVKIGSAGRQKLDDWVDGVADGAAIKMTLREIVRRRLERLCPWFSGTTLSAAVDLMPPIGTKLYQYAKAMILHPTDSNATNQDIDVFAVVPLPPGMKRTGPEFDKFEAQFLIYPDRAKLLAGTNPIAQLAALGPLAPASPAVTATGATTATLTWSDCSNETSYEIWQTTGDGEWTRTYTPAAAAVSQSITGLVASTTYWFMVRGMNAVGRGAFSAPVTCTTPAA